MEILSKIGFDWHVAIANLVNFLLIFYILKRFLFKPIARTLSERKKKIEEGLENSALAEAALREAGNERDRIVSVARAEANDIIGTAEKHGVSLREKRKIEAESEAKTIIDDARGEIRNERIRLESELAERTVALAILGAEKVLKDNVDATRNAALVKDAIKELSLSK